MINEHTYSIIALYFEKQTFISFLCKKNWFDHRGLTRDFGQRIV